MARELQFTGGGVCLAEVAGRKLDHGEVRARTVLSGISAGTELRHLHRTVANGVVRPGYEMVSRVVEVADDVDEGLLGALVWLDRPHAEEAIAQAGEAQEGRLPEGSAPAGRFAFLARTRTALNAVHDAELRVGECVLVLGLGVVGALIARIALLAGAAEVVAVDPIAARTAAARSWGARAMSPLDLQAEGKEYVADVVFEASGSAGPLATAFERCGEHGRIVVVSTYADGESPPPVPVQAWTVKQPSIVFTTTRPGTKPLGTPRWTHARLLAEARGLLATGAIAAEELIGQVMPFDRAAEGYELLVAHDAMAVLLEYEP